MHGAVTADRSRITLERRSRRPIIPIRLTSDRRHVTLGSVALGKRHTRYALHSVNRSQAAMIASLIHNHSDTVILAHTHKARGVSRGGLRGRVSRKGAAPNGAPPWTAVGGRLPLPIRVSV